ncbi:sterile alpha motif domain-containing protein 1-like [Panthera pardus]|uniref:Sterile alpha motif domain-containing protein 1-like n=1 Tax=Panthera pardus TaxID=9691 RepID=A0A9W2V3A9_PANPR|nr:sterile alpha motif domain-containing protein 1-like [Panthera pardus]
MRGVRGVRGRGRAPPATPPLVPRVTTCHGHPRGRGVGHAAEPPAPDGAATPCGRAPKGRRAPGPSTHPIPSPTHEGRALESHLRLCREPSGVRGSVLAPGPDEARRCRPHVTASGKMALAEERTEPPPIPDVRACRSGRGLRPPAWPTSGIWKEEAPPLQERGLRCQTRAQATSR